MTSPAIVTSGAGLQRDAGYDGIPEGHRMDRIRNLFADVIVGVVLLLIAWWVLRRVFGLVLWLVNTLAFVIVIIVLLVIANRIRGGRSKKIEF